MAALAGEEREPDCACLRTDVDIYDASYCDLHNTSSEWNRRQSAETMVERYEPYLQDVA
jgi:hypothetical protein